MAPEYAMDGTVSFMQDVYSFGVLLLEIVTGRKNNQGSFNLIAHVRLACSTCMQAHASIRFEETIRLKKIL